MLFPHGGHKTVALYCPFLKPREAEKHQKYDALCADAGWHFSAAAFGTWAGCATKAAKKLIAYEAELIENATRV
jgi:hypothetical protein